MEFLLIIVSIIVIIAVNAKLIKKTNKSGEILKTEPQGNKKIITQAVIQNLKKQEEQQLTNYIRNQISKNGQNLNYETSEIFKRRLILTLIFSAITLLNLVYLFVYHNNYIMNFLIEVASIIVYIMIIRKVTMIGIIKKKITSSPDDNMDYIIAQTMQQAKPKKISSIYLMNTIIVIFVLIPLVFFAKPHIIYEEDGSGYAIRYYTLALLNEKNIEIPSNHEGKQVTSIRGGVFKGLFVIRNVILPDSITEIRGEAFKDCSDLITIKLPKNITEIKGNTFENCSSLISIDIPEGVTRIGGHAFYGCSNLSNVNFPTTLAEIGSSAFRRCKSLKKVTIPTSTRVNTKAFKESPTIKYYMK